MAAVVAHEVKNPLAGIRGALQVIAGNLPAEGRERAVIGDIQARIDSLNEMVQDLLTFARPRAPNLVSASVRSMLDGTAALLRQDPQWDLIDIQITGEDRTIRADTEQLHIVFLNLLLNAAQAMRGQGRIQVTVTSTTERCEIAVRDTGPGIPPDSRTRMFEPFFTTKSRGTGLGLATAKAIVERHHGELRVDGGPDGGTVMVVSLPIGRSPSPTA